MRNYEQVYQFRVDLLEIKPAIWRRIQVPETYNFQEFHVAISDAMGWYDCHLHEFVFKSGLNQKIIIGIPDEDELWYPVLDENKVLLSRVFQKPKDKCRYIYDFGDYWIHSVVLEKILHREVRIQYPRCIKGKRRCPPEDVGSVSGYEELLRIMKNPEDQEYQRMMSWCGGPFDPDEFDCSQVKFRDPSHPELPPK